MCLLFWQLLWGGKKMLNSQGGQKQKKGENCKGGQNQRCSKLCFAVGDGLSLCMHVRM